ncbi:MAG: hypothetical protein JSS82_07880 [Bacteroidetes bacterium]|nr:hypothetical protein [Bacteroidota bacterium]
MNNDKHENGLNLAVVEELHSDEFFDTEARHRKKIVQVENSIADSESHTKDLSPAVIVVMKNIIAFAGVTFPDFLHTRVGADRDELFVLRLVVKESLVKQRDIQCIVDESYTVVRHVNIYPNDKLFGSEYRMILDITLLKHQDDIPTQILDFLAVQDDAYIEGEDILTQDDYSTIKKIVRTLRIRMMDCPNCLYSVKKISDSALALTIDGMNCFTSLYMHALCNSAPTKIASISMERSIGYPNSKYHMLYDKLLPNETKQVGLSLTIAVRCSGAPIKYICMAVDNVHDSLKSFESLSKRRNLLDVTSDTDREYRADTPKTKRFSRR